MGVPRRPSSCREGGSKMSPLLATQLGSRRAWDGVNPRGRRGASAALQPLRQPRAQDPRVWGLVTRTVSDMHASLCTGGVSLKRPLWPGHTDPARSE